jgi:hypothetical protein
MKMTFYELKRRLNKSSADDRMYDRPMNWDEAAELLKLYEDMRQKANDAFQRGYDQGRNDPYFLNDTDD